MSPLAVNLDSLQKQQSDRDVRRSGVLAEAITLDKEGNDVYTLAHAGANGQFVTRLPMTERGGATRKDGTLGLVVLGRTFTAQNLGGTEMEPPEALLTRARMVPEGVLDQRGRVETTSDALQTTEVEQPEEIEEETMSAQLEKMQKMLDEATKRFGLDKEQSGEAVGVPDTRGSYTLTTDVGDFRGGFLRKITTPTAVVLCFSLQDNVYIPREGTKMVLTVDRERVSVQATQFNFNDEDKGVGFLVLAVCEED